MHQRHRERVAANEQRPGQDERSRAEGQRHEAALPADGEHHRHQQVGEREGQGERDEGEDERACSCAICAAVIEPLNTRSISGCPSAATVTSSGIATARTGTATRVT